MSARLPLFSTALFIFLLGIAQPAACFAYFSKNEPIIHDRSSNAYVVESRLLLDRKRHDAAVYTLTRALHENPDDIAVAVKLADIHYRAHRYKKAIDILRDYVDRATARRNVFYYLALCFDRLDQYRNALGYYYKALALNPRLLKAYVRIARVRTRQGLVFDATKALKKALEIDSGYFPALQELKVVNRLVRLNDENVFRKENIVILFPDHKLYRQVEELYPRLRKACRFLEDNLKYHIPEIWIRVVKRIERFDHPPAFYDHLENCVYVETEKVMNGDIRALVHELCYLYLRRMCKRNCPSWLTEGLALWVSRPAFLGTTSLRSLKTGDLNFRAKFPADKNYLRWDKTCLQTRKELLRVFLVTRYLLSQYGWPAMRKILAEYRDGTTSFSRICWNVLHIDVPAFRSRWDMWAIRNYYFSPGRFKSAP